MRRTELKTLDSSAQNGGKGGGNQVRIIVGAIAVVILSLIAVTAMAAVKMADKDPKETVISAFENLHPKGEVLPSEKLFAFSDFLDSLDKKDNEFGLNLKLADCSDPGIHKYEGSGFRLKAKDSVATRQSSLNLGLIYNNIELMDLDAYVSSDKIVAAAPELTDKLLTVDLSRDLKQQVDSSPVAGPIAKRMGIDVTSFSDYVKRVREEAINKDSKPSDLRTLIRHYKKGCEALKDFKAALTVKKDGEKDFTVNGKKVQCNGYKTVVKKAAFIDFLNTSTDFFLQDEQFRQDYLNRLEMAVEISKLIGQGMGRPIPSELIPNLSQDQAPQTVKEMVAYLDGSLDDVSMTVYVDKKGRLAAIEGVTMLHDAKESQPISVSFNLELEGGTYLTQNFIGSIDLADGTNNVHGDILRAGKYDGKNLEDSINANLISSVGISYGIGLNGSYNRESGDYLMGLDISQRGKPFVSVATNGVVDQLDKGRSIHASIDNLTIHGRNQSDYVSLSGTCYWHPLKDKVTAPQGDPMDVLTASYDDWKAVESTMRKNVFGLLLLGD